MRVLNAIWKYFVLLVSFIVAAILSELALIAIVSLLRLIGLTHVPFVGRLLDEKIDSLPILGAIVGYSISSAAAKKLSGYSPLFAVGLTVAILQALFMTINLLNGDTSPILTNICMIVSGISLAVHVKSEMSAT